MRAAKRLPSSAFQPMSNGTSSPKANDCAERGLQDYVGICGRRNGLERLSCTATIRKLPCLKWAWSCKNVSPERSGSQPSPALVTALGGGSTATRASHTSCASMPNAIAPTRNTDFARTALMHTACTMSELVALGGQTDLKWDKATMFRLERDDFSLNHHLALAFAHDLLRSDFTFRMMLQRTSRQSYG